jgi:hypothetical protein
VPQNTIYAPTARTRVRRLLKQTSVLALPIWAGVLPIETRLRKAIADDRVLPAARKPSVAGFKRFASAKKRPAAPKS